MITTQIEFCPYQSPWRSLITVIHDTMDHAKTASPCFANRIKATDGFFKLPILVTSESGNNFITYPKHYSLIFHVILRPMDTTKMDYL